MVGERVGWGLSLAAAQHKWSDTRGDDGRESDRGYHCALCTEYCYKLQHTRHLAMEVWQPTLASSSGRVEFRPAAQPVSLETCSLGTAGFEGYVVITAPSEGGSRAARAKRQDRSVLSITLLERA